MMTLFNIELGDDGIPEPNFCSVCQNFEDIILYFLCGTIEVSMCGACITHAYHFAHEAGQPDPPAEP